MGRLTAAFVESARPGFWADGDNLYLDVRGANSKNWQLVYQRQGRERSKGLGSAKFVTLAEAREKAFEARRLLRQGIGGSGQCGTDPHRRAQHHHLRGCGPAI